MCVCLGGGEGGGYIAIAKSESIFSRTYFGVEASSNTNNINTTFPLVAHTWRKGYKYMYNMTVTTPPVDTQYDSVCQSTYTHLDMSVHVAQ